MTDTLILPVRKGGLGNQMFQVAAALVYARETGRQILLPLEFYNSHRTVKEDYSNTIFKEIPLRLEREIDQMAMDQLQRNGFPAYPGEPLFEAWSILELSGNILLHGYFQYYPRLAPHETLLREFYQEGLKSFLSNESASGSRVAIHIRRGDYLKAPFNQVHTTQPIEYYRKAFEILDKKPIDEYWIFSDDLSWCKEQSIFQQLPGIRFIDEPNECHALALMTLCQGGCICAASTFSWWGAFLGAFSRRSPCIVPKTWMRGMNTENLFPKEWIQIET